MKKMLKPRVGDMVKIAEGFAPAEPVVDWRSRTHPGFSGLYGLIVSRITPHHKSAPDLQVLLENGTTHLFYSDEIDVIDR